MHVRIQAAAEELMLQPLPLSTETKVPSVGAVLFAAFK